MPNTTGGRGVPRYVKQTPEQQQAYMEQLQSMYMGAYDPSQYYQQVRYVNCSSGLLSCRYAQLKCVVLCFAGHSDLCKPQGTGPANSAGQSAGQCIEAVMLAPGCSDKFESWERCPLGLS
jgi:hypothetical protein